MNKIFTYNTELYTINDIADYLLSKWCQVDYTEYKKDLARENFRNIDGFKVCDYDIWVKRPQKDDGYYHAEVHMTSAFSEEYWNDMKLYQECKKLGDMKKYDDSKHLYQGYKKKHNKVFNLLKGKFWMPKWQDFPKSNIEEKWEPKKSILEKIFGK